MNEIARLAEKFRLCELAWLKKNDPASLRAAYFKMMTQDELIKRALTQAINNTLIQQTEKDKIG